MTVEQFAGRAIRALCDRCAEGEGVWPPQGGIVDFEHGCHERNGVGLPPEPCPANVIHKLLAEHRQEVEKLAHTLFGKQRR